jgi:hypothetical protein
LLPDGPRRDYVAGHAGRNLPRALLRERIRGTATVQIKAALGDANKRRDFAGVVSTAANNRLLWRGNVNVVNTVDLNLWRTNFTLTSTPRSLELQITTPGLQSIAYVGTDVTTIKKAIENLKNGLENLF